MANLIKKEDLRFIPKCNDNPYVQKVKIDNANTTNNTNLSMGEKLGELSENLEKQESSKEKDTDDTRIGRIRYFNEMTFVLYFCIGASIVMPPTIILGIIWAMFVAKRRLNDLNKSGMGSFWLLIPLINLGFIAYLCFAEGDKETNDYGEPPVLSSWDTMIFIASLLIPFMLLLILSVVLSRI